MAQSPDLNAIFSENVLIKTAENIIIIININKKYEKSDGIFDGSEIISSWKIVFVTIICGIK